MNYKVYYINLDKSIQRKQFMEEQFSKLRVQAVRIPAVNGYELTTEKLLEVNKQTAFSHFTKPLPGEIGLFLSYKKAWSMIEKQQEDYAVLLEDDVLIKEDLFKNLPDILSKLNTDSILDISGRKGFVRKKSISVLKDMSMDYFSTPSLGTTGRIYSKLAASKVNQAMPYYLAPVDVMLQKIYQHKVTVYSSNKAYVKHAEELVGGTVIQSKSELNLKKIIKEIARPFWRLVIKYNNLIR